MTTFLLLDVAAYVNLIFYF